MSTAHIAIKSGRTCGTCDNWHNPHGHPAGHCVLNPPTAFLLGAAPPSVVAVGKPQDMVPVVRAYFPVTIADDGCRAGWAPRGSNGRMPHG